MTTTKFEGRRRLSGAHLLAALAAMFVVMPFVDRVAYGNLVESLVFTMVMLAAVSAVGGRRRTLIAAAVLAVPALLTRWLNHIWPELLPVDLSLVAAVVFVSFIISHLFRFVIFARVVNAEVLCAALSIYLLFAVAWGFLYTLLARWDSDAFVFAETGNADTTMAGFTALYFSVQILTALAFGDILPASNIARMMTLVEATAGIFYFLRWIAKPEFLRIQLRCRLPTKLSTCSLPHFPAKNCRSA